MRIPAGALPSAPLRYSAQKASLQMSIAGAGGFPKARVARASDPRIAWSDGELTALPGLARLEGKA